MVAGRATLPQPLSALRHTTVSEPRQKRNSATSATTSTSGCELALISVLAVATRPCTPIYTGRSIPFQQAQCQFAPARQPDYPQARAGACSTSQARCAVALKMARCTYATVSFSAFIAYLFKQSPRTPPHKPACSTPPQWTTTTTLRTMTSANAAISVGRASIDARTTRWLRPPPPRADLE